MFTTSPRRSAPWTGREADLRSLIEQLDLFIAYVNDQKDDIIAANESVNNLVGQFAAQKPVVDKALRTIPDALAVLKDQRNNLARRSRSWASSARWPPTRSTRPRKPWFKSSETSGRCWNHWPTRVRRLPAR